MEEIGLSRNYGPIAPSSNVQAELTRVDKLHLPGPYCGYAKQAFANRRVLVAARIPDSRRPARKTRRPHTIGGNEILNADGRRIRVEIAPRRVGDPPVLISDSTKAQLQLGWTPKFSHLNDHIYHAWKWFVRRQRS